MQCLVILIPFSISVYGLPRRASAASEKIFGVSKDFGQCTGGNCSPVQDMTEIGWQVFAHISCQSLFKGGARAPCAPPKSAPALYGAPTSPVIGQNPCTPPILFRSLRSLF